MPSRWRRGGQSSFPLVPESNKVKGIKVSGSRMRTHLTALYGDAGPASAAPFLRRSLLMWRGRRTARGFSKREHLYVLSEPKRDAALAGRFLMLRTAVA